MARCQVNCYCWRESEEKNFKNIVTVKTEIAREKEKEKKG